MNYSHRRRGVLTGRSRAGWRWSSIPLRRSRSARRGWVVRETECCSFVTFTLTATGGQVLLEVVVPPAHIRSCAPGHLTASAVVLSHDGAQVLLTLHPRVGRWVQLGGHCEAGDTGLAAAALREATEESGIADLEINSRPLHLDVHPITCSLGVPTRHFDVRFLLHAPADATLMRSSESIDLAWWPVDTPPPDVAPALDSLRPGDR
jgi:8-oxo-dGTP pyrophosphatase MutT (NUDIX family)